MKYAFDEQLGMWVVLAGGDVVVHPCNTEKEAVDYIETWNELNPTRGNE